MKKIMLIGLDDYHDLDHYIKILNLALDKGEKLWKGEEVGFDYSVNKYIAVFYRGPYPKEKIKEEHKRLQKIEDEIT